MGQKLKHHWTLFSFSNLCVAFSPVLNNCRFMHAKEIKFKIDLITKLQLRPGTTAIRHKETHIMVQGLQMSNNVWSLSHYLRTYHHDLDLV